MITFKHKYQYKIDYHMFQYTLYNMEVNISVWVMATINVQRRIIVDGNTTITFLTKKYPKPYHDLE